MTVDPYLDSAAPSEALGQYWGLHGLRWEADLLGLRRVGETSGVLAPRLEGGLADRLGDELKRRAELAAPGSELPLLVEAFIDGGLDQGDQMALLRRCAELQRALLDGPLAEARATRQRTLASLVAFFRYAGLHDEDEDGVLAASLIVGEATPQEWREAVEKRWREAAARHLRLPYEQSRIFWERGPSAYQDVLHYLVGSTFEFTGLDDLWRDVEDEVARILVEGGDGDALSLAWVAKSPRLASDVADSVRVGLRFLIQEQQGDGRWRNPQGTDPVFDVGPTAEAVIALSLLGHEPGHRDAAMRGADWLTTQQQPTGAWRVVGDGGLVDSAPWTARAAEALARVAEDARPAAVDAAVEWLWTQQNRLGLWEERVGEGSYLATVAVLDALDVVHGKTGPAIADLVVPPKMDLQVALGSAALRDDVYEDIIDHIRRAGHDMENAPAVYRGMSEEARRHVIQLVLNGPYSGLFTGETFNVGGKTDLLLRFRGANLFIAECKFWNGQAGFAEAVDQLCRYAGWRDRKLALVMFVRTKNPERVVERARRALEQHPLFIELRPMNPDEVRAIVRLPEEGGQARAT